MPTHRKPAKPPAAEADADKPKRYKEIEAPVTFKSLKPKPSAAGGAAGARTKLLFGYSRGEFLKLAIIPLIVLATTAISVYYRHTIVKNVNVPLDEPRVVNVADYKEPENLDRFWGTYRYLIINS